MFVLKKSVKQNMINSVFKSRYNMICIESIAWMCSSLKKLFQITFDKGPIYMMMHVWLRKYKD